jgi:hypothetical protein
MTCIETGTTMEFKLFASVGRLGRRTTSRLLQLIVSKAEDFNTDSEMRDAAVEQFIEERRQQALKMIAKMREPE